MGTPLRSCQSWRRRAGLTLTRTQGSSSCQPLPHLAGLILTRTGGEAQQLPDHPGSRPPKDVTFEVEEPDGVTPPGLAPPRRLVLELFDGGPEDPVHFALRWVEHRNPVEPTDDRYHGASILDGVDQRQETKQPHRRGIDPDLFFCLPKRGLHRVRVLRIRSTTRKRDMSGMGGHRHGSLDHDQTRLPGLLVDRDQHRGGWDAGRRGLRSDIQHPSIVRRAIGCAQWNRSSRRHGRRTASC